MTSQVLLVQMMQGGLIGICIGLAYVCFRNAVDAYKKIKKMGEDYAQLKLAKEDSVCKGPHAWDQIQLAFSQVPVGQYSVCKDCGFVGGTGYQLNGAGLEIFKNDLIRRAKRLDIEAGFAKKRIQAYYDAGLSAVIAVRLDVALDQIDKDEAEALNKV